MKTKILLATMVMVALCLHSCGGRNSLEKQMEKTSEEIDKLSEEIRNTPVPDDELLINSVLYQISDIHKVYDHFGFETTDVNFGNGDIAHYRLLLPKENGGFEVGYVVKTTSGVTIQTNRTFYFYNDLGLSERTRELYNVVGMVRADGSLLPMKITVDGKDNQLMRNCTDSDILTFTPLINNVDIELNFTVKELKDYCKEKGLTIKAVPFLQFTD